MKKSILIFTIILIGNSVFCQNYNRFLKNTDWYMQRSSSLDTSYFWYHTTGDTIIDKKSCKIISRDYEFSFVVCEDTISKLVWITPPYAAALYRFDLPLNCVCNFHFHNITGCYLMYKIDSVYTLSGYKKRMKLLSRGDTIILPDTLIWIEGIGATISPFPYFDNPAPDTSYELICSYQNEIQTYFYGGNHSCSLNNPGIIENKKEKCKITLYPNPCNTYINLKIENNNNRDLFVEILELNGKQLYSKELTNPYFEQSNSYRIDLSGYSKGVYFIKIVGRNFVKVEKIIKN